MPVIEARGLAKNFGATPVLRAVDLAVESGRGAIVTGINGAGKSTLLKLLAGLSHPSSGSARLFEQDSFSLPPAERRRLGIVTHQSFLYPNLTARENLEFYASLYRLESPHALAGQWLERVGLSASANERVRRFSRGMEQRLSIARAMLAGPDALLMDEPFAGLDTAGVSMVADLVRDAIGRGCAVMITAHGSLVLEEPQFERVELVSGRVVAIRGGRESHAARAASA